VANNLPHYATSPYDLRYALNFTLPQPIDKMLLHFNCHRIHHHDPLLPWVHLPAALKAAGDTYDISWLEAAVRQFRGPIPGTSFGERPTSSRTGAD
jgi:fatty acid desaturase